MGVVGIGFGWNSDSDEEDEENGEGRLWGVRPEVSAAPAYSASSSQSPSPSDWSHLLRLRCVCPASSLPLCSVWFLRNLLLVFSLLCFSSTLHLIDHFMAILIQRIVI